MQGYGSGRQHAATKVVAQQGGVLGSMRRLAVSVVSYQTPNELYALAGTLADQGPARLYVTVNHQSDREAIGLIRDLSALEVVVLDCGRNIGFGAGHELAFDRLEDGEWLVCLNPDVRIPSGWVESVVSELDAMRDTRVVLAGLPIATTGRSRARSFTRPDGFGAVAYVVEACGIRVPRRRDSPKYGVNGAAFCLKRGSVQHPFDARVFVFFEEHILAEKVWKVQGDVEVLDVPALCHDVGVSRHRASSPLRDQFVESQSLYLHEYLGWWKPIVKAVAGITRLRLMVRGGP